MKTRRIRWWISKEENFQFGDPVYLKNHRTSKLDIKWKGLHDGPCPNLRRGDNARALSHLIVSSRSDCVEHILLLWMSLDITDIILITTTICVLTFYDLSAWEGSWSLVSIWRFIYNYFFLHFCHFDCTAVAGCGKVGHLNIKLTAPVG